MRYRLSFLAGLVASSLPQYWAESVRLKIQRTRIPQLHLRLLARLLETGNFHMRAPFQTLDPQPVTFLGSDAVVTRCIYWYGVNAYEQGGARLWAALCREAKEVREIGANIGIYSVVGAAANPNANYAAFEPHPETFRVLLGNLAANNIQNTHASQVAVVPRLEADSAHVLLQIKSKSEDWHDLPAGATVVEDVGLGPRSDMHTISVPAIAVQDVVKGADLLKFDAEGLEGLLLAAASEHLLEDRPIILLERLPNSPELENQLELLKQHNFRLLELASKPSSRWINRDILAVPQERLNGVLAILEELRDH